MITLQEYALFAANSYGLSDKVRSAQNTLPAPGDLTPILSRNLPDGFMASAYLRGTELVISYAGTTFENLKDWFTGNLPAATASWLAPEIVDAAEFYLEALQMAQAQSGPSIDVSFTGHSLGGSEFGRTLVSSGPGIGQGGRCCQQQLARSGRAWEGLGRAGWMKRICGNVSSDRWRCDAVRSVGCGSRVAGSG